MATNLEQLIKDEQAKHAAKLKRLRAKAEKEEQALLVRVARLLEQHEPERFAQYRDHAAQVVEQERVARAERVKASRARRQEEHSDAAATAGDGGDAA